MKKFV